MLLLPFVVCLSPVVYGVVVVSSMPLRMLLRSITAFTVYVSWCSLLLLLLRGSFCTLTHMSVLDCGITGDASHGFCSGVADVLQSPHAAATASGGQGGQRPYCVHAEPVDAGVCPQHGPPPAICRGGSSTSDSESDCPFRALEGLGGLTTRPRAWFPRFPAFLDRHVFYNRSCGSQVFLRARPYPYCRILCSYAMAPL